MRHKRQALFALMWAFCAVFPAQAGDALKDHALNIAPWSWGIWGAVAVAELNDPAVPSGQFKRVVIASVPEHPWDVGVFITLQKPVKKGDVVVLSLWARAETLPQDSAFTPLTARVYGVATTSVSVVPESTLMVGKSWKRFIASGIADKDYLPGSLTGGIAIATGAQTLDIAQVLVAGFPPGFDVSALPPD